LTDVWRDPAVFDIHRLPGRSVIRGRSAPDPGPADDASMIDLNGQWTFEWLVGTNDCDLTELGRRGATGATTLPVPSVWQLHGYGIPYYLANRYPPAMGTRRSRIPDIDPAANEIGVYTRMFDLPEGWQENRTRIVFEGAKAGLHVFVNGQHAGYTQGSFEVAEFDITHLVKAGANTVTAVVYRYTDGSYLEDQDMWFFSGIFRPVWLHNEPHTAIRDLWVRPVLAPPYTDGTLVCHAHVDRPLGDTRLLSVDLLIRDPGSQEWRTAASQELAEDQTLVELSVEVPGARLWTAETPHLYEVAAALRDGPDVCQVKSVRTGVRSVEIIDEQLRVNGVRVMLKGVNRHDFDPDHGWAVPEHRYRQDLLTAKSLNINAIRTSHYPNPQVLYDLCDELGLYVMDECDLETHGVRRKNLPGNDPAWTAAVVDRMRRMVLSDRNHPSIIVWSLGNESGLGGEGGGNFVAMKEAARALDDSRPFHYEGDHNPAISDVISRMYATADQMAALGRHEGLSRPPVSIVTNRLFTDEKVLPPDMMAGRPVMQCEFAHSMENSLGNFAEHMDVFYRYPNMAGGFIWDYIDQSIRRTDAAGNQRWLYGGDFGDRPTHRYFCANGILAADRSEHPAAREVFWGYRNLVVEAVDPAAGRYRVTNRHSFTDAREFVPHVTVLVAGQPVIDEDLPRLELPPWGVADWHLPQAVTAGGGDTVVRFTFRSTRDQPWAPAGTIVAFDEVETGSTPIPIPAPPPAAPPPTAVVGGGACTVTAGAARFEIDLTDGSIASWRVDGRQLLAGPIRRNYWRALTDNDRGYGNFDARLQNLLIDTTWRDPAVRVVRHDLHVGGSMLRLLLQLRSRAFHRGLLRYDFLADGSVIVHHELVPRKDMIRLGLSLRLPGVDRVQWYGKGPHENYIDRCRGALTGIHDLPLADLTHDYMRPQENGNRTGVRWVRATGSWGWVRADDVTGDRLGFTAWPYTQEALDAAEHIHELQRTDDATLNIDRRQRGVGGDLPGLAALLPDYRMPAGTRVALTARLSAGG
jgi:beta-galactosidase